ncbi:MAG: DUF4221 domain-containing protein [Crocinitomicaceae bacterium]|nr:DUF4221 domain-containing protein [Crocinitomicaceae bacterium]
MKILKYFLIYYLLFFFFSSCSSLKDVETRQFSKFNYEFDTISKVYHSDFTKQYTGGIDVLTDFKTNYVVYNFCSDNTIKIINHLNDSVLILNQFNPDCKEVNTRIIGNDVYVILNSNKVYLYCDKSQNKELALDLMDIEKFKQSGLTVEWNKRGGDQHVNIPKNNFYFRVNQNYDDSLGKYSNDVSNYPAFAKLNIQSKEIDFYGKTPYFSEYREYGLISDFYDLYIGDSIITCNSISGTIEVINTLNNQSQFYTVKSKYDTEPIEKIVYPEDNKNINDVKMKHWLLSPYYESLFYNPFTNYYYRIFHPKMDELNEKGLLNTEFDKKCMLMVLNSKFELIDEVLLPIHKLQILKLYPTENGVLISLPDLGEVSKDKIDFKFLKISHLKK